MGIPCCCCWAAKVCLTLWPPWTISHQAPLSMGFPRQEYWSRLPCPPSGDLPKPGIEPCLLHCRWILYCWATRKAWVYQPYVLCRVLASVSSFKKKNSVILKVDSLFTWILVLRNKNISFNSSCITVYFESNLGKIHNNKDIFPIGIQAIKPSQTSYKI